MRARAPRKIRVYPKPFVWHKTAEEILDRLAGYCTAINE